MVLAHYAEYAIDSDMYSHCLFMRFLLIAHYVWQKSNWKSVARIQAPVVQPSGSQHPKPKERKRQKTPCTAIYLCLDRLRGADRQALGQR